MGANLIAGGATFKVWAPSARGVYLNGTFASVTDWQKDGSPLLLVKDGNGYWTGFLAGVADGDEYKFYVVGPQGGSVGYKRDPYARELTPSPPGIGFPTLVNCIVRAESTADPHGYPWHDGPYVTPDFSNLILYQLHVGAFAAAAPRYGNFLDVIAKIPYLVALGVNAIQPLPITECQTSPSQGYNGADYFSPDMVFTEYSPVTMNTYLNMVNGLLAQKGQPPLTDAQLEGGANQLKAMVDLCHLYGIAVFLDVVYNHAGDFDGDDECLFFWDRQAGADNNDSLYFIDRGYVGGLAFALWKQEVRQFLIDNASFLLSEYHADGFRYDQVSQLLSDNSTEGWPFCQALTNTVRYIHPRALQNAEYWPSDFSADTSAIVRSAAAGGTGFDAVQHDALRLAIRGAIRGASYGGQGPLDMTSIANSLLPPGLPFVWNAVTCVENHDLVHVGSDARMPVLADGSDAVSFYARSRAKVATGILLTAPGIPHLFMGQEYLENQQWNDNPVNGNSLSVARLSEGYKPFVDQLRFTQDLIRLRWSQPGLRGQSVHAFHVHDQNRVLAFHRWIEEQGRDVVVVVNLADSPYFGYDLGFPSCGHWLELFNSDVYDNWVNPLLVGNNGGIDANGGPLHTLPASASIVLPPRAILVFGH